MYYKGMIKEIFRAGKWTSAEGKAVEYGVADIDAIISTFDDNTGATKQGRKVPLTIGHPEDNAPAFGYLKKVWREGERMIGEFCDVLDVMRGWIEQKSYEAVSIALNEDGVLRHVGVLGGVPPAVPGLGAWQFADNSYTAGELSAPAYSFTSKTFQSFNKEKKAMEPEKKIEALEEKLAAVEAKYTAAKEELDGLKKVTEEEKKGLEASLSAEKTAHEVLRAAIVQEREQAADAADATFADTLSKTGKLRPADREICLYNLRNLRGKEAMEFSMGDKKEKKTPLDAYKASLESAPVFSGGATYAAGSDSVGDSVETLARLHMEKNPGMTYSDASLTVLRQNPTLNKE